MATDLEDFLATTEHRRPGRILYSAGFTEDLLRRVQQRVGGKNIAEHYGYYKRTSLPVRRPAGLPPLDYSKYIEREGLPPDTEIRNSSLRVPGGFYHFTRVISPLRNATRLSEIEEYPLEDMRGWDFSHMEAIARQAHAQGRVVVGNVGHIYETAWQIRGMEPFMLDMIERPAWAECLCERIAGMRMIMAVAFARAGADVIHCGDDIATQQTMMFSLDLWRTFLLSRWRRIWQEAKRANPKARIFYHSDGNITQAAPDLIDAGVDILNPLQPEALDVDAIHEKYGKRVTLDGTIGTQSTMPFGTPAEVRARVKEVIEKYGRDGGLIIEPTHVLEPEVPLENIDAFADACREFGTFE